MNSNKTISLFMGVMGIIIGVIVTLFSTLYFKEVYNIVCIIIGIVMIIINIFPLLLSAREMSHSNRFGYNFAVTLCFICLSTLFIFNHSLAVSIVFGSILILLPSIRVVVAINHKFQFLNELPLFLLGILLFFNFQEDIFNIALIVFGIVFALLSLINVGLVALRSTFDFKETINSMDYKEAE